MNVDSAYHRAPILGVYYYPRATWPASQIARDLDVFAAAGLKSIWLFFDPFYDVENQDGLRALLDHAGSVGLTVVPALGQFLQLEDHPEVKIVNADGTTSDDPRYWNMGCFRHPKLLEIASARAARFFREFGDHPALYRMDGKPAMNFVHEAYYRNSVPEFGGGHMTPNCYCDHCLAAWRDYLTGHGLNPDVPAPRTPDNPEVWQHWLACHAEAIPDFLRRLIAATKTVQPLWATHECNDFYPASWQSVYTGNDWWRMAAALDFGHEDMYPLEFDTRYVCYVYDYAKDVMRSAMGFRGLITANGQAFNSWLGYQLPENSMSEQVYSALAHGALGLVWWTELPGIPSSTDYHMVRPPTQEAIDTVRYRMIRQTARPNAEYAALVEMLAGHELATAQVALVYSWTTMGAALNDDHTYDMLLAYQMLVQAGYPVDVLSEAQIGGGVLAERGYKAVFVLGCSALPDTVRETLNRFAARGGMLVADHAPVVTDRYMDRYAPLYRTWRAPTGESCPRIYTLPDGTPVPVALKAGRLIMPPEAAILARYEDGSPAICQIPHGEGQIVLAGSFLGWDYTSYPGYYDLGRMFPFHVRQDAALRRFVVGLLHGAGIVPPVTSAHPDVETAVWALPDRSAFLVFAINHLMSAEHSTIRLALPAGTRSWQVREALSGQIVSSALTDTILSWEADFSGLQGRAFRIHKE